MEGTPAGSSAFVGDSGAGRAQAVAFRDPAGHLSLWEHPALIGRQPRWPESVARCGEGRGAWRGRERPCPGQPAGSPVRSAGTVEDVCLGGMVPLGSAGLRGPGPWAQAGGQAEGATAPSLPTTRLSS